MVLTPGPPLRKKSSVPAVPWAWVIAAAVPRTYRKGQLLFVENDPGESLIVLRRGAVAVFRTAPTGERAVLNVIRPPDVLGEVSLLDASTRSASAEAIEDFVVSDQEIVEAFLGDRFELIPCQHAAFEESSVHIQGVGVG